MLARTSGIGLRNGPRWSWWSGPDILSAPLTTTAQTTLETGKVEPSSPAGVGLWKRCAFQTVRTSLWILAKLLTINGLYRFGRLFGTLEWCVSYKRRRMFAKRLRHVFGADVTPAFRRRETLAHFRLSRCDKVFYMIMDMLPREIVLERFHIDNRELLDRGMAAGKGVYIALSHQGAQHVVGLCLALLGYRVAGVRDRKEGGIRRYVQGKYERKYPEFRRIRLIFSGAYPRDIYRCLSENYVLGSSLDIRRPREAHQRTATVTIFGQQCDFLTGPLHIALRCKSTVLQCFFISEPGFHYRLRLLGPLVAPERNDDTPALLNGVMQAYAENVEFYAQRYPAHISR